MTQIDLFNGSWIIGDCLEKMKNIPDNSIDMILCDLPYGTTACSWDTIIPFDALWEQYNRITHSHSPIVLFGNNPFTSLLIGSNIKNFKQALIWNKNKCGSPGLCNIRHMQIHEDICVSSESIHI